MGLGTRLGGTLVLRRVAIVHWRRVGSLSSWLERLVIGVVRGSHWKVTGTLTVLIAMGAAVRLERHVPPPMEFSCSYTVASGFFVPIAHCTLRSLT